MANYNSKDLEVRKKLAADENTPADILQQLSEDSEAEIRYLVASNPNTFEKVLHKLGEEFPEAITANPIFNLLALENSESRFIKLSLARSSTTSEEILASFADTNQAEDEEILCAVANNVSTPIHILEKLAVWSPMDDGSHPDGDRVHRYVAKNPKTPLSLLEKLANHQASYVRKAVAENYNSSPSILDKLARNKYRDVELIESIAKNLNTSTYTLEYLAGDDNPEIWSAILKHPNVSTTAVEIIRFMEEKPGTSVQLLDYLATDSRIHVRRLVADHSHTSTNALEYLTTDNDYFISQCIIDHPNSSSTVLAKITHRLVEELKIDVNRSSTSDSYSKKKKIILNLINSPRITSTILLKIANLEIHEIMRAIAELPTAPADVLKKLAEYGGDTGYDGIFRTEDAAVHFWGTLSSNPNMPSEGLEILFTRLVNIKHFNTIDYLRKIASHPNASKNLL